MTENEQIAEMAKDLRKAEVWAKMKWGKTLQIARICKFSNGRYGFETKQFDEFTKPIGFNKIDTDRCIDGKWARWGEHVTHQKMLPAPPKLQDHPTEKGGVAE